VDGAAHQRTESAVHELMLFEQRFAAKGGRYDAGLVVVSGASQVNQFQLGVAETTSKQAFDFRWLDHSSHFCGSAHTHCQLAAGQQRPRPWPHLSPEAGAAW